MNSILRVCVIVLALGTALTAQNSATPVLPQQGIHVQLPVSNHSVAIPDADRADATVLTVTAEGDLYDGADPIQIGALPGLCASTVYVKADARASYQQVLSVLSALSNHTVVLLTQPTVGAESGRLVPPYGLSLAIEQR